MNLKFNKKLRKNKLIQILKFNKKLRKNKLIQIGYLYCYVFRVITIEVPISHRAIDAY